MIQQKTNLPKGWKEEELGNVANFLRGPFGSSVQKSECVVKGKDTYKLYEQGNIINNDFNRGTYYLSEKKFKELEKFEIKTGDILITCAGTLGRIAIAPENIEKGIINSVLMRIRIDKHRIDRDYFLYFFKSSNVQNDIQSKSAGVAVKNLFATKLLKKFVIPLPSIEEQSLIVSAIETQFTRLDEAVKSLKSVKDKLEIYRKAVLKKAFEKKEGWEEKPLNEVCIKINDGTHFTPKYIPKGVKFISVKDIRNYKIDFSECKHISEEEHKLLHKRCNPERGDVLITKSGTIGRTAIVETDEKFDLFVSVALLKPIKDKLNSKFLMYFLRGYIERINIDQVIKGAVVKNFHIEDIKETRMNLPKSLSEQAQIVQEIESKFSVIDKVEEVVEASLKKAEMLRKSILKSAFEGKLVKI